MLITRKDKVKRPFVNPTGERIYEMIGRQETLGGATKHSFGHVVIPPKCCSRPHYHPEAEETYAMLKGKAKMVIDDKEFILSPGDTVLVRPPEHHQIFNIGNRDLEFLCVCAPAWEPTNSVYLDEK
jgi:mannose-6-phosphate isomerase-like protein (cupin superfamily)